MSLCSSPHDTLVQVDAKRADRLAELPAPARHLIARKRADGTDFVIYRGVYVAEFALSIDSIERGTTARHQSTVARIESALHAQVQAAQASGRALCLLSAEVEECNGAQLAVPVAWNLELAPRTERRSAAPLPPFDPARHVVRPFVAEARRRWRAATPPQREVLLVEPLVYRDAHLPIGFAAVDAWGFRADELMQNVARALGDGSFFIPLTYRYSGLLAQVHACIVLANARANSNALYAETLPRTAYELSGTREGYEIGGAALADAIEFIQIRLLPALVVFDPRALPLTVVPCGAVRWTDIWATHQTARENGAAIRLPPTDGNEREIKCTLRIVAHFVELDAGGDGAQHLAAPHIAELPAASASAAASTDSPRAVPATEALAAAAAAQ